MFFSLSLTDELLLMMRDLAVVENIQYFFAIKVPVHNIKSVFQVLRTFG